MSKHLNMSCAVLAAIGGGCTGQESAVERADYKLETAANAAGIAETVHTSGAVDRSNPFFQALGANQRTCETCHSPAQGWTMTADALKRLFDQTDGLAPVFMIHDAGGSPTADISTRDAREATFRPTTVDRGVIRFTRTISPTAEFAVVAVSDPYGFSTLTQVSAFRRPSPTANESKVPATGWAGAPVDPFIQVASTSAGATRGHEQRVAPLTTDTLNAMRDLQFGVVFAQSVDNQAGPLDADGARGGAANLAAQPFYVGINDIQGHDPSGAPYTHKAFDLFDAWAGESGDTDQSRARAAIYRGQELFNNREFDLTGVAGINDVLGQTTVRGTCSLCHNAPNVGSHSVYRMFDIGSADEASCADALPLITLQNKATGAIRKMCDMGRGTGTGKWADLGGFRAPPLRGLAARAPYFHDGQAKNLKAVVRYFDRRFDIGLSSGERDDLEAFLQAL
jgi:cytochrome c peroxidase